MNNILLYSDLHINQENLKECILILEEIGMFANKYNIDTLINLGDTFDGIKPSSKELDIFATFINRLGNKQHIILAANSHESTSQEESILNHYGILSNNVKVVKEFKDNNHLYCGHFSLKESLSNYDAKLSKINFKGYAYVFLGHIHSYQLIKPNICHLGSTRYVDFSETYDKAKIIAIITDYGGQNEKVHFLKLESPYKMYEFILKSNKINKLEEKALKNSPSEPLQSTILSQNEQVIKDTLKSKSSISEGENPPNPSQIHLLCQKLDKLPSETKIKVKIQDFESYKAFLPLEWKYKQKFITFKRENDFELVSDKTVGSVKNKTNIKESFEEFAKEKNIDNEIKNIIGKEIK